MGAKGENCEGNWVSESYRYCVREKGYVEAKSEYCKGKGASESDR